MKPTKIKDFRGSEEQSSSEQKKEIEAIKRYWFNNQWFVKLDDYNKFLDKALQKQREEILEKIDTFLHGFYL